MEKRTLLAVVLALGVWLLWSYFFVRPQAPQDAQPPVQEERADKSPDAPASREVPRTPAAGSITVRGAAKEESITVTTDKYTVVLSNRGAAMKSVKHNARGTSSSWRTADSRRRGV